MKALVKGLCGHNLVLEVEDVIRDGRDILRLLPEGKYVRMTRDGSKGCCFREA